MTGRRLYDAFTDAMVRETTPWQRNERGAIGSIDLRPKAWPILSVEERRIWNALAKRITPKRKPKTPTAPPAIQSVYLRHLGERKIQAIKEFRAFSGLGLLEAKTVVDYARIAPYRWPLRGRSFDDVVRALPEMEVTAGA